MKATVSSRPHDGVDAAAAARRLCRRGFVIAVVCAMVVAGDCGVLLEAEASCAGRVASEPYGGGGFGYDPVFFLPDRGKTMAEVGQDVKNRISHRARAVHMLRDGMLKLKREHG